jgi:hypothetical protein
MVVDPVGPENSNYVGNTAIYGILEFFGLHFNCQKNVKVKNKNISTNAL